MSDPRFDHIDNPTAQQARDELRSMELVRPDPIWPGPQGTKEQWEARYAYDRACQLKQMAKQEQDVVDKRAALEIFARMIEEHKLAGEAIEKFAEENDLPGFCSYDGLSNWLHSDIIGTSLQWAASNHNC
ncbi:hypothetical protein QGX11_gp084 [Pseudomonas phage PPSC2]|uniref:Uncharacterized protein n=1 Tax=Pseudomonas phage PPSC2 TaxID=2041350 RepID=A0A2R2YAU6_9CAUD|nr:hypothetical protein QGX11_gp084 [Pseudomonas phage PPSC2]ATN92847.1 hypothetical protein PPSC2_84 [Pseudomonas phage PPSC2]